MAATKVDLRQLIEKEYKRCAIDPQYFIRRFCYIQHPQRGRILFELYKYQDAAIDDFEKFNYNIILKGRQIGISTAVACYSLWLMLFHRDKNILVIATKQDTAKTLITKVRFAFDHLPIWLQVQCTEHNKLSLSFKNGSAIKAATAASDSARSQALSLLILDEAAFIKNAEEIWTASLPTLSTGGKAVLISTPNGLGNFFHQKYSEAIQEVKDVITYTDGSQDDFVFHPIKLDWRVHPDRDEAWRANMGKIQGERQARQEFDAEFIGSGNTVIDAELIEFYATLKQDPVRKAGFDNNLWIWEEPNYTREYMVVADVARGDGSDFSACHVIELATCTQVAEYKGKIGTTEWGHFLVELATRYNDALLVIERENVGWDTIQTAINRQYKNLFYMSKDRQVVEVHRNVSNRYRTDEKQMVPGFGTTMKSRPVIINKLDMYMRDAYKDAHSEAADRFQHNNLSVTIRSLRTIEELRVFVWENGKAQASEGYNDDLVMALSIGLWVRDVALKLQQAGVELTRTALDNFRRTGGTNELPAGVYMPNQMPFDPYHMPLGRNANTGDNDIEDLRWLLG